MTEQNHQSGLPEEDKDVIIQNMTSMHNGTVNVVFREYPGGISIEGLNLSERFQPQGTVKLKRRRRQISEIDAVVKSLSDGGRKPFLMSRNDDGMDIKTLQHALADEEDYDVTGQTIFEDEIKEI